MLLLSSSLLRVCRCKPIATPHFASRFQKILPNSICFTRVSRYYLRTLEFVGNFEHQPAAALGHEACRHAALEVVVVEEILDVGGER